MKTFNVLVKLDDNRFVVDVEGETWEEVCDYVFGNIEVRDLNEDTELNDDLGTQEVFNINWDTHGKEIYLPTTVNIPDTVEDEYIADYLSDKYGWCVKSFGLSE